MLITENGFVYAYAQGSQVGNCICSVAFFKANRARFHKAGWQFNHAEHQNTPRGEKLSRPARSGSEGLETRPLEP
jgi:hypothetical protein